MNESMLDRIKAAAGAKPVEAAPKAPVDPLAALKAKLANANAAQDTPTPAAAIEDTAVAVRAAASLIRGHLGTLYIGCMPADGHTMSAHDIVSRANAVVCAEQLVPHYKACEYGKGPGYLDLAVAAQIADLPAGVDIVAHGITDGLAAFKTACRRIVFAIA